MEGSMYLRKDGNWGILDTALDSDDFDYGNKTNKKTKGVTLLKF